jgi:hypothetical protein
VKHRGHPIRGAIAGFFFGLFLSLDLVIFGVVALDSNVLALFPILGLAAGIALGLLAPLHRRSAEAGEAADGASRAAASPASDAAPEAGPGRSDEAAGQDSVLVSPEPGPGPGAG